MTVSIIVALSEDGVIGRDGGLPWHLPADLKRFKALTMGHHLLMGRKTWESIGRPLPGRTIVVVTRDPAFSAEGVVAARSFEEALEIAAGDPEVFIGGGGEIYAQAIARADRMYVTRVRCRVEGDVRFPPVDWNDWILKSDEPHPAEEGRPAWSFEVWQRP